jgi:plastocyanin
MTGGRVLWAVIVALFVGFAVAGPVIMVRDAARADQPVTTAPGGEIVVVMTDLQFRPATLQVPAGATVLWSNQDVAPHTVTSASEDSGFIDPGASFTVTVDEPFAYACTLHPSMTGVIEVT